MKLSEEQVLYIDNYLVKNQVKYWDVRMELLDHIVRTVEGEMENGKSFQEALLEVHKAFGNKITKTRLNRERTEHIAERSLFLDHSGYSKLLRNRERAYHWHYQKTTFKTFLKVLRFPGTLIGTVALYISMVAGNRYFSAGAIQQIITFVIVGALIGELIYMFARNLNVSSKKDLVSARFLFNVFSPAQVLNYLYLSFGYHVMNVSQHIYFLLSVSLILFNIATFVSIEEHRRKIMEQFPYLKTK